MYIALMYCTLGLSLLPFPPDAPNVPPSPQYLHFEQNTSAPIFSYEYWSSASYETL